MLVSVGSTKIQEFGWRSLIHTSSEIFATRVLQACDVSAFFITSTSQWLVLCAFMIGFESWHASDESSRW